MRFARTLPKGALIGILRSKIGSAWLIYPEMMCHTYVFSVESKNRPSRTLRACVSHAHALNVCEMQFWGQKYVQQG